MEFVSTTSTRSATTPVVRAASEYPSPPPCCQRAHEQGYRRGYQYGYTYALWDLGKYVRISESLWQNVELFLKDTLAQWVWRAYIPDSSCLPDEGGPRFRRARRTQGRAA